MITPRGVGQRPFCIGVSLLMGLIAAFFVAAMVYRRKPQLPGRGTVAAAPIGQSAAQAPTAVEASRLPGTS